jgi:hypothetical protein
MQFSAMKGKKSKQGKKKKPVDCKDEDLVVAFDLNNVKGHEKFEYSMLLDRIETIMSNQSNGPEEEEEKEERPIVKPVSIKTAWVNFESIRTKIDRPTAHILDYFSTQLGKDAIVLPEGEMIISGRFK